MLFNKPIGFLIDTGSQVILIPHATVHDRCGFPIYIQYNAKGVEVRAYGGAVVPILGVINNGKKIFR